jgi:hypothetical protein
MNWATGFRLNENDPRLSKCGKKTLGIISIFLIGSVVGAAVKTDGLNAIDIAESVTHGKS